MFEEDLYRPVHNFLEQRFQDWVKPERGDLRFVSAVTARAGGVRTGIWSKPDLCFVALWRHKYSPLWSFDVHGFEVKTPDNCDPTAVHEALNHTALVHYSHLVWYIPGWDERSAQCRDIHERCTRYGIGLIVVTDPDNVDSFSIKAAARRHEPAGDAVDEFIETRLPLETREVLLKWIEELR